MTRSARRFDSIRAPLSSVSTTPPQNWISWSVVLNELQCVQLPDGIGRKPYIFPFLVWLDDFTKTTPLRVGITGPLMQDVSSPLSDDMHAGDTVPILGKVGNVGTYTFEASEGHNLYLVVALFEHHDFEESVIEAGFTVFQPALQAAIATKLNDILPPVMNPQAFDDVKTLVKSAVTSAFTNALSDLEKIGIKLGTFTIDAFIDANFELLSDSNLDISLLIPEPSGDSTPPTQYNVLGQLQVGTTEASLDLPFDCASGGPFPAVNLGSVSGDETLQEDGDVTLDKVSKSILGLTSRHGGITIAHTVDENSSVVLTACSGVSIAEKIQNHSHATIVAHGDVTIGQKIDQHSTADIDSQSAIDIGQKIDQHSVANLAARTVHIGQKIDQHSTAAIIAVGDIKIDQGISANSTAYITSLNGSITIGQSVDGNSVVTLRAPNGNVTIKQKVGDGATVNVSATTFTPPPDTGGGTINQLPPFPPVP